MKVKTRNKLKRAISEQLNEEFNQETMSQAIFHILASRVEHADIPNGAFDMRMKDWSYLEPVVTGILVDVLRDMYGVDKPRTRIKLDDKKVAQIKDKNTKMIKEKK